MPDRLVALLRKVEQQPAVSRVHISVRLTQPTMQEHGWPLDGHPNTVVTPTTGGTILSHEIDLAEHCYETLRRSLRLEVSVVSSQKLLNLMSDDMPQL
jgi:hypothetical protein